MSVRISFFFLLLILNIPHLYADGDPVDPADLLFAAFSSRCASQGSFTARALNDTSSLINVLTTIKDDDPCSGLKPLLNSLTSVNEQLGFLNNGFGNSQYEDLANYKQKLSIYLSLTSDPNVQSTLADELANVQLRLIKSNYDQQTQLMQQQSAAVQNLTSYLDNLSEIYPNQTLCFQKNPILGLELAGHLMSLSGGFFGSVANAALTVSGRLLSSVFDYLNNKQIVDAINHFRGVKLQAGLSCVMESLEQTACDIDTEKKLISLHQAYRGAARIPDEWNGYDIFQREYPILQAFLNQVEGGNPAASLLQGQAQATFRQKQGNFKSTVATVEGLIAESERQIKAIPANSPPSTKKTILDTLLQNVLSNTLGYGSNGPSVFADIRPTTDYSQSELWLRLGTPTPVISPTCVEKIKVNPTLTPYSCMLLEAQLKTVDTITLRANVAAIEGAARTQLQLEEATTLNPDQKEALVSWTERGAVSDSPGVVMQKIISYLDKLRSNWKIHPEWFDSPEAARDQIAFVEDTLSRFQTTMDTLRDSKLSDVDKISKIFDAMVLEEQDTVITARMRDIVQADLEKSLRFGLFKAPQSVANSVRLANDEVVLALAPNDTEFLDKTKRDLAEAEVIAKSNLLHFYDFFRTSLLNAFQNLWDESERWHENYDGPNRVKLAKLCILALNAPQLEEPEFQSVVQWCQPQVLASTVGDKTYKVEFASVLKNSHNNPDSRICSYRHYTDQIDIAETIQGRK